MLSIVCPVYNEAENIEKLLKEIQNKISISLECIIVYDDASDNTLPVLQNILPHYGFPIKIIQNNFGSGALNAIKTGFVNAQGDSILVTMADLSDNLSDVPMMYNKIQKEQYDVVCGSRYMRGGCQVGGPFLKKFLSSTAGKSLFFLRKFPTHDVTNNFKMYRKKVLDQITIESSGGFEIGMEIVTKAFLLRYKITEIPTTWTDRTHGTSNFRLWKWMPRYLYWYFYAFKKRVRPTSAYSKD